MTPWIVAHQAPWFMGFSRQEYWSGLLFPSPGDPPNPGIEPGSPALRTDALLSEPPGKPPSSGRGNFQSEKHSKKAGEANVPFCSPDSRSVQAADWMIHSERLTEQGRQI